MLTRAAFVLAMMLASVSGSLAAGYGMGYTETIYNPSGARIAAPDIEPACWRLDWGFPCK
jgi:hypothetical protein